MFQGFSGHLYVVGMAQYAPRVARDDHEKIVEVVGDATGQPADRLHLLGVVELFLDLLASRDFAAVKVDIGFILDRTDREGERAAFGFEFQFPAASRFQGLPQRGCQRSAQDLQIGGFEQGAELAGRRVGVKDLSGRGHAQHRARVLVHELGHVQDAFAGQC